MIDADTIMTHLSYMKRDAMWIEEVLSVQNVEVNFGISESKDQNWSIEITRKDGLFYWQTAESFEDLEKILDLIYVGVKLAKGEEV